MSVSFEEENLAWGPKSEVAGKKWNCAEVVANVDAGGRDGREKERDGCEFFSASKENGCK